MKITNIILTSQNGGAEQVFLDYCKILKNRLNHEISAIIKKDAPYAQKLEELGIKTIKIDNKFGHHDIFAAKNIRKAIKSLDSDTIITHSSRATILSKKALKSLKNKPLHVAVNHSNNVKRSIGCDLLISVNKNIFYKTIDLGQDPKKSIIIANSIKINEEINKNTPNFNKNTINLGIMGRFDRTKGYPELLEAMRILKNNDKKKFTLKIAGDGYFKKEIIKQIKQKNLEKNVELLGWIKNKADFFSQIDIFTLPSTEETFGLVLLEAMNHQVPIISSDCDGPKEILRDNQDAIFAKLQPKENYPKALSRAISDLANNENIAKNLVKNAKNRLKQRFSFQNLEKSLQDVFGKA